MNSINDASTITLNELLPISNRVRKIQSGSELLLAYELNKYAKLMLNKELVLSDVTIANELLRGEHFSFVVLNGLNVNLEPVRDELADITKNAKYYFKDTIEGVKFVKSTPEEIVYAFEHDIAANRKMHDENRSAAYVSMVAYFIVKSYADGVAMPKIIIDHENYNQKELEYVDLFILKDYGNCILKDMIEVRYSNYWGFQPEWSAFIVYNRQRGVMNGEYTVTEKYKYLRKNFEVGDVVLFYQRTKGAKGSSINQLKACYPAIIRYFDQNIIKITYFPIVQTRFTRHNELSEVERNLIDEGRKPIYTIDDYNRFLHCDVTFNLTEIGVDTRTWIEQNFFIKPIDFDGSYQFFRTPEGTEHTFLSTLDTIYAVFEDRGVDYNKDKFLATYFNSKKRIPVYEQYKARMEAKELASNQ